QYGGGTSLPMVDGRLLAENALLYGAGLLLLPPFPLVWLAARPRQVGAWAWAAAPAFAFFLIYSFHDRAPSLIETLVGGQRFVLAAHGLLLVATAPVWARPRLGVPALALGAAGCLLISLAMRRIEARYLPAVEALGACGARRIAYNQHAARVALAVPAREYHLLDGRAPEGLADAYVVTARPPSHTGERGDAFDVEPYRAGQRAGDFLVVCGAR